MIDPAKLRTLRQHRGLTMRGLSRRCKDLGLPDVPHSALSQIEAGERQPREPKALALATALGVPLEALQKAA